MYATGCGEAYTVVGTFAKYTGEEFWLLNILVTIEHVVSAHILRTLESSERGRWVLIGRAYMSGL